MRVQPFPQASKFGEPVRNQVDAALKTTPIDDPPALLIRQRVQLRQQRPGHGRGTIGEQMHEHRTAGGDFARFKRTRALVSFQIE
jgi:hypothetical protein